MLRVTPYQQYKQTVFSGSYSQHQKFILKCGA